MVKNVQMYAEKVAARYDPPQHSQKLVSIAYTPFLLIILLQIDVFPSDFEQIFLKTEKRTWTDKHSFLIIVTQE